MNELIDKIIYINLEKRKDRKEQIENELNNFQLPFERFNAIETPGNGIVGCGLSHLNVLKIAKERKYKNILILEDDFTFLVSKEEFEKQVNNFFNLHLDYNVLFFSYNLKRYQELNNSIVNKVLDCQTASGYLIHENYYDKLINLYEESTQLLVQTGMHWIYANDQIWKQYQEKDNWYYFIKRIGKQRDGYSDNCERYVNYLDC
jgi:glycosyl transferase family 25